MSFLLLSVLSPGYKDYPFIQQDAYPVLKKEQPVQTSNRKSSRKSFDLYQQLQAQIQIERSNRILEEANKMRLLTQKQINSLEKVVQSPAFEKMNSEEVSVFAHQLLKKCEEEAAKDRNSSEPLTLSLCTKIVEAVQPYQVKECSYQSKASTERQQIVEALYDDGEAIVDYIKEFDTSLQHTINTKEYLDVRISRTIVKTIQDFQKQGDNVEILTLPRKNGP